MQPCKEKRTQSPTQLALNYSVDRTRPTGRSLKRWFQYVNDYLREWGMICNVWTPRSCTMTELPSGTRVAELLADKLQLSWCLVRKWKDSPGKAYGWGSYPMGLRLIPQPLYPWHWSKYQQGTCIPLALIRIPAGHLLTPDTNQNTIESERGILRLHASREGNLLRFSVYDRSHGDG